MQESAYLAGSDEVQYLSPQGRFRTSASLAVGSDEVQYLIPQDILGTDDSLPILVSCTRQGLYS